MTVCAKSVTDLLLNGDGTVWGRRKGAMRFEQLDLHPGVAECWWAVESSIDKMDEAVGQPIPMEARQWLGMLGFRIVIDDRGQVVDIEMPAGGIEGDGDEY